MVNDLNDEEKFYFRLTDTTFEKRYRNHNRDFKHEKYENSIELAKYIHGLIHLICLMDNYHLSIINVWDSQSTFV